MKIQLNKLNLNPTRLQKNIQVQASRKKLNTMHW